MNEKKGLAIFLGLLSALASICLGGYLIYPCLLLQWWFIPLTIFFVLEGIFILISLFKKEQFRSLKLLGVFQIVSVIVIMTYLLVMILWNNPTKMEYYLTYIVIGLYSFIKIITFLVHHFAQKKVYSPLHHGLRNNDLISLMYVLTLVELIIIVYFDKGETRAFYLYIIEVLTNAIFTIIAGFFALSSAIMAGAKEVLTPKAKAKYVAEWFKRNEVSMYFSLTFTTYLAILAAMNIPKNTFYIFLFIFYLVMAFLRIIAYIWHQNIVRNNNGWESNVNHYCSKIFIFNAFMVLINGVAFAIGALLLVLERFEGGNLYTFIFFLLPFTIMRVINTISELKKSKKNNDVYIRCLAHLSLISVVFSVTSMGAIGLSFLPNTIKILMAYFLFSLIQLYLLVTVIVMLAIGIKGLIKNKVDKTKRRDYVPREKRRLKKGA